MHTRTIEKSLGPCSDYMSVDETRGYRKLERRSHSDGHFPITPHIATIPELDSGGWRFQVQPTHNPGFSPYRTTSRLTSGRQRSLIPPRLPTPRLTWIWR